uniref:Uncharacterized protein n=1 Tax=Tanacetum cinerariifolium TaxID=118510 RepID=A0A6L2JQK5_TANCI|nr:hypothetical protein [Tanacetum cinerariifolium]
MDLHAVSRACHHPDGLVRFSKGSDDMSGYIVGISKPSNKDSGTEITEGLVFNAELLDRVFKVPITTVKCIPHGCRLAFSQALKTVYRPKNRQEHRFGNRKSLQQSFILKSLAMWGKDNDITTMVKSILDGFALGSFGQGGAAVKVLSSSGVAPYCDDTIKALEAKHPYKPPPSMPSITFFEPPLIAQIDSVFSCIKSFPKGSAEAILHSVNRVLSEYHNDGPLAMLIVDFSNAFNLHPLLHKIKDSCKLLLHAWYLDDGTVIGDSEEVVRVLDIRKVNGPGLGLELNIKKTEISWPSCNGIKLREGLFLVDIRRPSSGVKLLGGAVSRDADFISGLAMRRVVNAVDLMGLLLQLHDPHSELRLLRSCLRGSIENIVVCGGPFFGDLQWRLSFLPIRFGGLGMFSAKLVSSYAFVASMAQSLVLQNHILRDSGICGMDDDYVSALACLRDTIPSFDVSGFTNMGTVPSKAQQTLANVLFSEMDFLLAILIDGLGQYMSPVEYRTILKYRLMILLFPVDAICPVCRKACLDSFGEHAVHCKEISGFKYRHDMVRGVLFDICGRGGLSSRGFTAGQAALKAASGKMTKHEKACIENQHVFIPFAFDTFGLAPEAVELLSRVQRVMHSNVMTLRSTDVVFKRIGFAIQKGLAAQLVARVPSTTILNPQPQALSTTFKARVRDYMAAHTERIERFKNAIFKQCEEIDDRMTEMFGLHKELITSRTPEKVLIREEAKSLVNKNANSISLARKEEERSDKIDVATVSDIEKPFGIEIGMQANKAEKENKAKKKK